MPKTVLIATKVAPIRSRGIHPSKAKEDEHREIHPDALNTEGKKGYQKQPNNPHQLEPLCLNPLSRNKVTGILNLRQAKLNLIPPIERVYMGFPQNPEPFFLDKAENGVTVPIKKLPYPERRSITPVSETMRMPPAPCPSRAAVDRSLFKWRQNRKLKHSVIQGKMEDDNEKESTPPGWVITFKDGRIVEVAPQYLHFYKTVHRGGKWLVMEWILGCISKFLLSYGLGFAEVVCQRLLDLAAQPLVIPLSKDQILQTMAEPDQVCL